jgi:hypothetical protein
MITLTRRIGGSGRHSGHSVFNSGSARIRPLPGGATVVTGPLPVTLPGTDMPFAGMDPSNPLTYVRPWNPQPGMIGYLNYDGAQAQARQPTGGLQRGRQQRRAGYR